MSKNTAGYFYEGRRINRLFGLSSLGLLGSMLWMIWQDHHREWKGYQLAAREMEIARLQKERAARAGQVDAASLEKARRNLAAASKDLEARRGDLEGIRKEIQKRTAAWYQADQEFRAAKAETDAARYRAEEARHRRDGDRRAAKAEAEYQAWLEKQAELRHDQELKQAAMAGAQAEAARLTETRDSAVQEEARLTAQVARIEKRLNAIGHSLANDWFRDQPGVDYMAPTLKVQQAVPPDLKVDYNFVQVQRVDRCMTCHVNIDKPGFEENEEGKPLGHPFRSHPRLDLFTGSRSAHPMESFGCTVCHGGQGGATDFLNAYHAPRDKAQAQDWEKRHGWLSFQREHAGLWSYPMLPRDLTTASCRKCHAGEVAVDAAPSYNRGKHIFEQAGCWGCHKVLGFEPRPDPKEGRTPTAADADRLPKIGPDLDDVGCKLTQDFAAKWISDPKHFRPHTRMPSFFGVAPEMTQEMRQREADEIQAITAYLFQASRSAQHPSAPSGDAGRGEKLFQTLGCLACHSINGEGAGTKTDMAERHADFDSFGPDLGKVGSKTSAGWLFAWLKDPKHYFPGGRMPSLRLSDAEAADLAAWLMTLRDEAFELEAAPAGDPARMRGILLEKLRSKETRAVVDYVLNGGPLPAELARLPEAQRPKPIPEGGIPAALGEHMIRRYGCNGCHVIPGFADDKGIGAELTEIGSKDLAQVDFGFVEDFQAHGPFNEASLRTRHAWLEKKVTEPRVFDIARQKAPLDRLIMPQFGLSGEDARDLTTFLMSLAKERVPMHRQARLDPDRAAIERGRRLVKDNNCTACHVAGAFPQSLAASSLPADKSAWLADHLLLTRGGEPDRAGSAREAGEKQAREKPSEREALLAPARSFLTQRPPAEARALEILKSRNVEPQTSLRELLAELEKSRQRDPFKPAVPLALRVAGIGEGLPGRWIADRATGTSKEETGKFAPPFLMDLGTRVQPDWLHRFLLDPAWEYGKRGGQPIRPAVPLRMPSFGFTPEEADALVRYFTLTAEASYPFSHEAPARLDPAARKAAHFMATEGSDCRSCHQVDGGATGAPVGPDLDLLAGRLRREWLRRYIQDPNKSQPYVVMPAHWQGKADGTVTDEFPPEDMGDDFPKVLDPVKDDGKKQLDAIVEYLMATSPKQGGK